MSGDYSQRVAGAVSADYSQRVAGVVSGDYSQRVAGAVRRSRPSTADSGTGCE